MQVKAEKHKDQKGRVDVTVQDVAKPKGVGIDVGLSGVEQGRVNYTAIPKDQSNTPTVVTTPSNGTVYSNETITIRVEGLTNNSGLTVEQAIDGLNPANVVDNVVTLTATKACTGTIKLKHSEFTTGSEDVTITFEALDVLTVTSVPVNAEISSDQEIVLTVAGTTKQFTATSDVATVIPVIDGSSIKITTTQHGTANITIGGRGIQEVVKQVTFTEPKNMTHTVSPANGEVYVNEDLVIEITDPDANAAIVATPSSAGVVVTKDANNPTQYKLTSQDGYNGDIVFKSVGYKDLTVSVNIKPLVVLKTTPSINDSINLQQNKTLKVTVNNAPNGFNVNSSDLHSTHVIANNVITFTGKSVGEDVITITGRGIEQKQFKVNVTSNVVKPQFTVPSQDMEIRDNQLPYTFQVGNLVGQLTARISNPMLFNINVNGDEVTISKNTQDSIHQVYNLKINLNVPGQNEVVVNFNVLPDIALPIMPCNGKTYYGFKGEEIYFNTPTLDSNDQITATSTDANLSIAIRDVNRVYLKSDVEGHFMVKVTHSEYQPAMVAYICNDKPKPPKPQPDQPNDWYDLGPAPVKKIQTTPDSFVKDVFSDASLTTDPERITYVLEYGDGNLRSIANLLCTYNKEVGISNPAPKGSHEGGIYNRRLYDQFLFMFGTSDYYMFREFMRLTLRIMKHYRDNSMNTILLMRFEDGWVGTRDELAQFRNIATFLNSYIDANGQNVKVTGLKVSGDGIKNMERFCSENIQP